MYSSRAISSPARISHASGGVVSHALAAGLYREVVSGECKYCFCNTIRESGEGAGGGGRRGRSVRHD